jgi:SAM-dependent methyltransferase
MTVDHLILNRAWSILRNWLTRAGLAEVLLRLDLLGLVETRRRLALRHIEAGSIGLEIGALHCPLPLPAQTRAYYIDKHSAATLKTLRADAGDTIIRPDILADGLRLDCIASASQDFVVANHLLEHAQDALGTLGNWLRVLRPGGVLFVAVPIGDRCFDRGREITSAEHFRDDYRLSLTGDHGAMRRRNQKHVEEHLAISAPALAALQGKQWTPPNNAERARLIAHFLDRNPEQIHHHVFSRASLGELLHLLCQVSQDRCRIERIASSRVELIGIVRRLK